MTINRIVSSFAGFMILMSLTFAQISGQIHLQHVSWLWLTTFVGINLFQMGFTGFCPLARLLRRMGIKGDTGTSCQV